MAKKKAIPKGQLGDWGDEVPEDVQDAADAYDKAHTSKSKATAKLNSARDNLVENMRAGSIRRVRIRNGEKCLVVDSTDRIKYEKPGEVPAG